MTDLPRLLRDQREALRAFEGSALAEVAESLSRAAEMLADVSERLERQKPFLWLTPEMAAEHVGCKSVAAFERVVAKEGIPKHYLSDRLPRYNVHELDEWLASR